MATIRLRGSKWQVQVRRTWLSRYFEIILLRKDAVAWARQIEAQADRAGIPADPRIHQVGRSDQKVSGRTVLKRGARVEHAVLSRLLNDPMSGLALSQIGPETFAKYRDHRLKTVTPGTLKRQLNPIRNMFEGR
jgi:hypothetical protein